MALADILHFTKILYYLDCVGSLNQLLNVFLCTVTKPTVGKVYTQFVVNQLCSQQQKLQCAGGAQLLGSVQKVVSSSNPVVVVGQRIAAQSSPEEQGAGGTKGPVVTTLSPSKQATQKVSVGSLVSSVITTVTTTTITTSATSGGSSGTGLVIRVHTLQSWRYKSLDKN